MGSRHEINSSAVRKRIENHDFNDEGGEEYEASSFGGFGDYMRRKKIKLQNLDAEIRSSAGDCPPIFRGVVAHVNGYTQPSLQDLHHLIVSHGGGFLQYLDGKTAATHIIASALTPKKREEFRRYRIVKPAWVTDSIKAGRLLAWDEFRIVDEGQAQRVLKFDDGRFTSQTNSPRPGYKDQSRTSWYDSQLRDMTTAEEGFGSSLKPVIPAAPPKVPKVSQVVAPTLPSQPSQSDYGDFPSFTMEEEDEANVRQLQDETSVSDVTQVIMPHQTPNPNHVPASPDPLVDLGSTMLADSASPTKPALTSEEYNAQLLSDPRMQKSSVVNPEFLQQYYRESRLHHLSTWKAGLKAQLQAATKENSQSQISKKKPGPGSRRYILHVDFDSFFAAVSLLNHPELQGKPVAIAHGSGSGSEIASCNYPARARGVKNGMWMKGALQLCPELKVLPYDFPAYEDASRKFYTSILAIDGTVQSVSIDEALIDITNTCMEAGGSDGKAISEGSIYREQAKADEIAQDLRDSIKEKTGCAVSIGIGNNILLAKVSLRKAKPAGQFQLKPDAVLDFIGDLTVRDLPGVGNSMAIKLEELGVKFVKDIRDLPKERLISALGPKTGIKLWEYTRGIDRTEVGDQTMRKSVSAEVNWGIRFVNQDQADHFVRSLCEELNRRLMENLVKGKQLTLKVMRRSMDAPLEPVKHLGHGKCDTFNKSVALSVATNVPEVIGKEAISMLRSFNFSPGDLRGLGVQMTKLEPINTGPSGSSGHESSQRKLNFQMSPPRKKVIPDADSDELESPQKDDSVRIQADPVLSDSAHKPLNISGSQFIMPTQADPKVLAELPTDIRSRLVAQAKPRQGSRSGSPCPPPREARQPAQADLPPQSQLDPDALAALPEDVRKEVLEYYNYPATIATPPPAPAVPVSRQLTSGSSKPRRPASPPKKRRGRPPKSATIANKPKPKPLNQSSFGFVLPRPAAVSTSLDEEALSRKASPNIEEPVEASAEFLAALPEDIRQELLEEQQRSRMQQRSQATEPTQRPPSRAQEAPPPAPISVEKLLPLPPLPKRPVFTSQRLSQLPDLRDAVGSWHEVFAAGGPYGEDVTSLCKYLSSVTLQEKDVDKAVSVVRWLMWLVGDHSQQQGSKEPLASRPEGTISWVEAIETMQHSVRVALEQRELPPVDFS
ncbi:DNA repair protein Rev1 [Penicillium cf. griseofulvum]|nr:DNA repair protein Rev1 [Penicillium cf. griseofulvum]